MSCKLINSYIKISSLGPMIKHEQFYLNYSTKHINSQKLFFENTVSGIVKPSVTIPEKSQIIGSLSEPAIHGHSRPLSHQSMIYFNISKLRKNPSAVAVTAAPMVVQKFTSIRSQGLGPIRRPLTASLDSNIRKVLKEGIKPK